MSNIEQLEKDNIKLQERLTNAAKIFKEQKLQIESLTKENEQLKNSISSSNDIKNLQSQLEAQENSLKEKSLEYKNTIDTLNTKLTNNEAAYEELRKKYNELKGETSNKYAKLQKDDANAIDSLKKQISEQDSIIESKDKAHSVIQDTYNELFEKYKELSKKHDKLTADYIDLSVNYERLKNINNYSSKLDAYKLFVSNVQNLIKETNEKLAHKNVDDQSNNIKQQTSQIVVEHKPSENQSKQKSNNMFRQNDLPIITM